MLGALRIFRCNLCVEVQDVCVCVDHERYSTVTLKPALMMNSVVDGWVRVTRSGHARCTVGAICSYSVVSCVRAHLVTLDLISVSAIARIFCSCLCFRVSF